MEPRYTVRSSEPYEVIGQVDQYDVIVFDIGEGRVTMALRYGELFEERISPMNLHNWRARASGFNKSPTPDQMVRIQAVIDCFGPALCGPHNMEKEREDETEQPDAG